MKRNKPVKIKRYRRSFSGAGDRNNLLRRIAFWCAVLAVVFALGWLIAKPGLDRASSIWYGYKNRDDSSSQSAASGSSQVPSLPGLAGREAIMSEDFYPKLNVALTHKVAYCTACGHRFPDYSLDYCTACGTKRHVYKA